MAYGPIPSLRAAAKSKSGRDHEIVASWVEQGEEKDRRFSLTIIVSYKGWAAKNPRSSQTGGDYCVRPSTAAPAASFNPKTKLQPFRVSDPESLQSSNPQNRQKTTLAQSLIIRACSRLTK